MDAWWLAPVVVLVAAGATLVVAVLAARRSAAALVADRPVHEAVGTEVAALHDDLRRVADRLEERVRGAGAGTPDR